MKIIYVIMIACSVFFNTFVQSYAYEAWQAGVPMARLMQAKGNVDSAFLEMNVTELSGVNV